MPRFGYLDEETGSVSTRALGDYPSWNKSRSDDMSGAHYPWPCNGHAEVPNKRPGVPLASKSCKTLSNEYKSLPDEESWTGAHSAASSRERTGNSHVTYTDAGTLDSSAVISKDMLEKFAEDNKSYCSTKSWTSDGVQDVDLRSSGSLCEAVEPDETNEDLGVVKLQDGKFFIANQLIHEAQNEPSQREGKHASSWHCEDLHGNRSKVVGLGTARSYDAIFKPEFKFLPKYEVDAWR